jgi:hypothetical protein
MLGENAGTAGTHEFSLNPNATTSQIGSGDVITEMITNNGTTTPTPTTVDFVFSTVPAIASYSDTAGHTASISYPDTSNVGTNANPLPVGAGPNGDVVVTFTVWRPQRAGVPGAGEPAYMDIGHLWYSVDFVGHSGAESNKIGSTQNPQCSFASYSSPSSTLTIANGGSNTGKFSGPPGTGMVIDSVNDQAANPANTLSFTVDLTQCLKDKGESEFLIGKPLGLDISANSQSASDHANQTFVFERKG